MAYFQKQLKPFFVVWFAAIVGLVAISEAKGARPPTPSPCAADGVCRPNRGSFGYSITRWRPWPGDPQLKQPTLAGDQAADDEMRLNPFEHPKAEEEDIREPVKSKSFDPAGIDSSQAPSEEVPLQTQPEVEPLQVQPEMEPLQTQPEEDLFQAQPEVEPLQAPPEEDLFREPPEEAPSQEPPEEAPAPPEEDPSQEPPVEDLFNNLNLPGNFPSRPPQEDAPPKLPRSLRKLAVASRLHQITKTQTAQPKKTRSDSAVVRATNSGLVNPAAAEINQRNRQAIYHKALR